MISTLLFPLGKIVHSWAMLEAAKLKCGALACEFNGSWKTEIAERQKGLFAYVLLGQQLPPPLASLDRASCPLPQSLSVLPHLREDSGFLHQTAPVRAGAAALPGASGPLSALPEFLALFSLWQFLWQCGVKAGGLPQHHHSSSSLSIALRGEHFGFYCVSFKFDRFSPFSP